MVDLDVPSAHSENRHSLETLHQSFENRTDATFELVDALTSNTQAKTVVELSLNPRYRRNYCSLTRSIDEFYPDKSPEGIQKSNQQVSKLLSAQCPLEQKRLFHLFAVDCVPTERLFSPTLEDRSPVYTPRPTIAGNKPITIGHKYSVVAYLPEKLSSLTPPWVIPLSSERISTGKKDTLAGMQQITHIIQSQDDFKTKLCVSVADSAYSTAECLNEASKNENQVHISRVRSNRTLNKALKSLLKKPKKRKRGRPARYGEKFKLKVQGTWGNSIEAVEFETTSQQNKTQIIKIEGWKDILMRSPFNLKPFRLIRIRVLKPNGELLFKRSLWLLIAGKRQDELSLQEIFLAYRQRFDIEHFFRFGKTRLLLDKFQTPEVEHEEAWSQFAMMSYVQLYMARQLANNLTNPWEIYSPEFKMSRKEKSPSQVQKDFGRLLLLIRASAVSSVNKPLKVSLKLSSRSLHRRFMAARSNSQTAADRQPQ